MKETHNAFSEFAEPADPNENHVDPLPPKGSRPPYLKAGIIFALIVSLSSIGAFFYSGL